MADRAPTPPSLAVPLVDKEGRLSVEWYKYLTGGVKFSTNVNSGVALLAQQTAAAEAAPFSRTMCCDVTMQAFEERQAHGRSGAEDIEHRCGEERGQEHTAEPALEHLDLRGRAREQRIGAEPRRQPDERRDPDPA